MSVAEVVVMGCDACRCERTGIDCGVRVACAALSVDDLQRVAGLDGVEGKRAGDQAAAGRADGFLTVDVQGRG